jgi:hypothetical protein
MYFDETINISKTDTAKIYFCTQMERSFLLKMPRYRSLFPATLQSETVIFLSGGACNAVSVYIEMISKEAKCGGIVVCANEPRHPSVDGSASRKSTASPVCDGQYQL